MAGLDTVLNWLRGSPPSLGLEQAAALPAYPSQHDADYARNYGFGDNSVHEDYLNNNKANILGVNQSFKEPTKKGKDSVTREMFVPVSGAGLPTKAVLDPENSVQIDLNKNPPLQGQLRNTMMQAALAANHSPIAAMGFDPSRTTIDTEIKNPTVAGLYGAKEDQLYVPHATNDAIVHESMHRGMKKLRDAYPDKVMPLLSKLPNEEMVVRALMAAQAGDPEGLSGDIDARQRKAGISLMDNKANKEVLRQLEELAIQDRLTRSRRSGPQ